MLSSGVGELPFAITYPISHDSIFTGVARTLQICSLQGRPLEPPPTLQLSEFLICSKVQAVQYHWPAPSPLEPMNLVGAAREALFRIVSEAASRRICAFDQHGITMEIGPPITESQCQGRWQCRPVSPAPYQTGSIPLVQSHSTMDIR